MIQLQANPELKQTFEKLIGTMQVPVKWNGVFVAIDNYLILQGEVRSLFFHFDTRKVTTNIIEIPAPKGGLAEIGTNMRVQNAINIILYAFGKWDHIKGLRVDKSYAQLKQLFTDILREFEVEPEYTPEHMRFYRNGMRITYEDVIQMALEYSEKEAAKTGGEDGGLWHKIVWKRERADFVQVETTLRERRRERLGKNFYMVGYLCPSCGEKLHMVVYPMGKEFRIETEEGGVICARICTCSECGCFYTPRPKKLLAEGDAYIMEFGEDVKAYEDYLELLGRDGDRVSNYRCNVFADGRDDGEEDEETLKELARNLPELSDIELEKLAARMEEGFYPDASIENIEGRVREQSRKRKGGERAKQPGMPRETGGEGTDGVNRRASASGERNAAFGPSGRERRETTTEGDKGKNTRDAMPEGRAQRGIHMSAEKGRGTTSVPGQKGTSGSTPASQGIASKVGGDAAVSGEMDGTIRKFAARMEKLDRYSGRQLRELKNQLEHESKLPPDVKHAYMEQVERKLLAEQTEGLKKKVDACAGKNYSVMKRVFDEIEDLGLPAEEREPLLARLRAWMQEQAGREVEQLVQKMPANLDRAQYKSYMERIRSYEGVDTSPYEGMFHERREAAEQQEIANLVKRARKVSREDIKDLIGKLRDGDFLPELVEPYLSRVEEKLREMDERAIAELCPDPMHLSYEEGMEAYERIEQGDFLPELKSNALAMLKKRLSKIKTDECELLVKKLKEALADEGLSDNPRHHFYPARRVLMGQAAPEETELIEFALASYAAGRGPFEYPVLVVDATKNGTGKEGLIITPEHLYYSTMFSAYGIPIGSIRHIDSSVGLLNKGLFVHQAGAAKTKVPYAVETKELSSFARVLDTFVKYLRERPDSRKVDYLAREKHEKICCYRCGFEYQGAGVCPKCGYQNNE